MISETEPTLFKMQEAEVQHEIVLENCTVASNPQSRWEGDHIVWECMLYALPDITHQERDELVKARATGDTKSITKLRLRSGDRCDVRGIAMQQEVHLTGGETRTVNYIAVSAITVLSRSPRKSLTEYERRRGRR